MRSVPGTVASAPGPAGPPSHLQRVLAVAWAAVFAWSAIRPHDFGDWLLENVLVVALLGALVAVRRHFRFSNLSSALLFVFLVLHAIGSHYTYSLAPPGEWISASIGTERNHYDRAVHLAFGLLLTYPMREVARRVVHVRGFWAHVVPFVGVLAMSATYEILEWAAARVVAPDLGIAFVGTQGDVWDAQKDMTLAALGALISTLAVAIHWRATGREPWNLLAHPPDHLERDEGSRASPELLAGIALAAALVLGTWLWLLSLCL